MKLALMALVIEICLARLIAGSWGWAVAIVILYCLIVYVRQMVIKRQNKDKSVVKTENTIIQGDLYVSKKELYDMYPTIGTLQQN